ncbi:uncharacterized protein LOC144710280 [Wolffia australiana]
MRKSLLLPLLALSLLAAIHGSAASLAKLIGAAECSDCAARNVDSATALQGMRVAIGCKSKRGKFRVRGMAKLDKNNRFSLKLPSLLVSKRGKLREDCFAQLLGGQSGSVCRLAASRIVLKYRENDGRKHVFSTEGRLSVATAAACDAKNLFLGSFPFFKPWPKFFPTVPQYTAPPIAASAPPDYVPQPVTVTAPAQPIYIPTPVIVTTPAPPVFIPAPVTVAAPAPPIYIPAPVTVAAPAQPIYVPQPVTVAAPAPPVYVPQPTTVVAPAPPVFAPAPPVFAPGPPVFAPAPPFVTPSPPTATTAPPVFVLTPATVPTPVFVPAPPATVPTPVFVPAPATTVPPPATVPAPIFVPAPATTVAPPATVPTPVFVPAPATTVPPSETSPAAFIPPFMKPLPQQPFKLLPPLVGWQPADINDKPESTETTTEP